VVLVFSNDLSIKKIDGKFYNKVLIFQFTHWSSRAFDIPKAEFHVHLTFAVMESDVYDNSSDLTTTWVWIRRRP